MKKRIGGWLIISAILSSILFYSVLFTLSKWFPTWTGRSLQNEWVLVVISAIPLAVVLVFLFASRMTKAKIGDNEFEFGEAIPPSLIDADNLRVDLLTENLTKEGELDLPRLTNEIKGQFKQPKILLVLLDQLGKNIKFQVLREYIYELSKISQVEYIIFLEGNQYIGFTTVEKFKERFPKFGIEVFVDDLRDENLSIKIIEADLPILHSIEEKRKYINRVNHLIRSQWAHNRGNQGVRTTDLQKIGALEIGAIVSWPVEKVYSLLIKEDLKGIPIVDKEMKFIGIASQDKIAAAVIHRLLEQASDREKK